MNVSGIKLTPVKSQKLAAIGYDVARQILAVQFFSKGQPGSIYHYANFSADDWAVFSNAESHGKHFIAHIQSQKEKYPYTNIGAPTVEPQSAIKAEEAVPE